MAKETRISWAQATWNPFLGCTKVTTECTNCYAERDMLRYGRDPHKVVVAKDATFYAPLHWKEPKRVFVCSWSDFFHEDVDLEWRNVAWSVMEPAYEKVRHTFIILTKRPQNIRTMLPANWHNGWPNIWFLVSAGTNESLELFWPTLARIPNLAVKGISMEPLLEDITWTGALDTRPPTWVIVAGESGPNRRPMDLAWARHIRDGCAEWGIPFFFKGHIGNVHTPENEILDGVVYHEFPRGQR